MKKIPSNVFVLTATTSLSAVVVVCLSFLTALAHMSHQRNKKQPMYWSQLLPYASLVALFGGYLAHDSASTFHVAAQVGVVGWVVVLVVASLIMRTQQQQQRYAELFKNNMYPCRTVLSDTQYLQHMIPHHQVAIDVSKAHAANTSNDTLATVMRALIWTQQYEVDLMKEVLRRPVANVSASAPAGDRSFMEATFSQVLPNTLALSTAPCDPNFFDRAAHATHMQHMGQMTDQMYFKHMIPHHQVAIDMSKLLIKHTTNDFMMHLAYRIIRAQEGEIKLLYDLQFSPAIQKRKPIQFGLL
jgi:uncharacterized protein (DUF305 family)